MPSIVEPARAFIDATASLLEDEGYVLGEELVPLIGTSSVVRSSVLMMYGYIMECWWWGARDPLVWKHQVDLVIYKDTPLDCRLIARLRKVKTPEAVVEFLLKHCPDE